MRAFVLLLVFGMLLSTVSCSKESVALEEDLHTEATEGDTTGEKDGRD